MTMGTGVLCAMVRVCYGMGMGIVDHIVQPKLTHVGYVHENA